MLYQISIIIISGKHSPDRRISPLMKHFSILAVHMMISVIIGYPMNTILKKSVNNPIDRHTVCILFKYSSHNFCCFRINDKFSDSVFIYRMISIRSHTSYITPILLASPFGSTAFCRNIFCICIINQIFNIHR